MIAYHAVVHKKEGCALGVRFPDLVQGVFLGAAPYANTSEIEGGH